MSNDYMSQQNVEDNTHYVVHVRVEKALRVKMGGIKIIDSADKYVVEDVVNVTKKSDTLMNCVDFVKGVLDLTEKNDA